VRQHLALELAQASGLGQSKHAWLSSIISKQTANAGILFPESQFLSIGE
jgi:hypothetical protein